MNFKIGDKKLINAWAFYDWANSVYSLVISTAIFPLYYTAVTEGKTVRFLGIEWSIQIVYIVTLYRFLFSCCFNFANIIWNCRLYRSKKKFMKFFCWMEDYQWQVYIFLKE